MRNMETDRPTEKRTDNAILGKEKRRLRAALSQEIRICAETQVAEKLFGLPLWQEAKNLLFYVSWGAELSTIALIERALTEGKQVFCPKVTKEGMEFYPIESLAALLPGYRGILEPCATAVSYTPAIHGEALLIAPGSVFDLFGHRIGYGGGYYDRYLARFSAADRPYCIGVCFACQLTDRIQAMPHDVSMDLVLYA